MGVDFSAMFQHSLDLRSIEIFKDELVEGTAFPRVVQCISEVNQHNPHLVRPWSLNRERIIESHSYGPFDPVLFADDEYIEVDGPGGFSFIFNKNICEFQPCFRWYSFIENKELQFEIRTICKEISNYLGYNFTIYMGDNYCASDYIFEGRDMEYYKAELLRRFGKSKNTISELIQRSSGGWESEGYFIDYFSDMPVAYGRNEFN
ncbi:hypothetical protein NST84_21670 [Paenibacillus sp. FSL R7-0345]|uniref:hypothetical protein n=1 Tax=Paenibacillus sp. FSL R7-0345 TaxID=2954535 RepID=UPI003159C475